MITGSRYLQPGSSDFFDTSFERLMLSRVAKVLMVCSRYDTYILEEDGRIEDQLFHEYTSLKLRNPPIFLYARTSFSALDILRNQEIDLVILMDSAAGMNSPELALRMKKEKPQVPLISLTPFQRSRPDREMDSDFSSPFDYQFQWLGQADILLGIVKLIEDRMNAEHDIHEVGAQAILLVEDSVHFTSLYLPLLYKLLFKQSLRFMSEGLNEHQQMLRLRGRPKLLLARTFEEALVSYERYKHNMLGVISDVEFYRDGCADPLAGFLLQEKISNDNPRLPFILQSSEPSNQQLAYERNLGYVDKNSDELPRLIEKHCLDHLGFGDFVFRNPINTGEIDRAHGLPELQQKLLTVSDDSLTWHLGRNDLSRWLKANALFKLAGHFQFVHLSDLPSLSATRQYISETISAFRMYELRGRVARFDRRQFDEYFLFSRLGDGSLGGKARGLAYLDEMLWEQGKTDFAKVNVRIPRTVVLTTDIFSRFMEDNGLSELALSDAPDTVKIDAFLKASLPVVTVEDLKTFISVVKGPLAVRSSSLLEDSLHQPFAGIYSTYMVPGSEDVTLNLENICRAIKAVYASTYSQAARSYMSATSIKVTDEKMAVILQEVVGSQHGRHFYPSVSGVARSLNFYPVGVEKAHEGVALLAIGLGRYVVSGGLSLRFSPAHPRNVLQLSAPVKALNDTQKHFLALDSGLNKPEGFVGDGNNIVELPVNKANPLLLKKVSSTYDRQSQRLSESSTAEGIKVITFNKLLNYDDIPLARILQHYLKTSAEAFNHPVELEFAMQLSDNESLAHTFYLLQVRPMLVEKEESLQVALPDKASMIAFAHTVMGNVMINGICDLVYAVPERFDSLRTRQMADSIAQINERMRSEGRMYVLAAPGRWGSSDPNLGIPVQWTQISNACLLIETHLEKYRIEPSQGTHFFHNLTTMNVGYFSVTPYHDDSFVNFDLAGTAEVVFEDDFIRHLRLPKPLQIMMNARDSIGFVAMS
jgi:hypothetical protein